MTTKQVGTQVQNMDQKVNVEQPEGVPLSPQHFASDCRRQVQLTNQENQGGRKYMEDEMHIEYHDWEFENDSDKIRFVWAFFGIFDGHGGREAAVYARKSLVELITSHKVFYSEDDQLVLKAIKHGFTRLHREMELERRNWSKTTDGSLSNAGTTASVVFMKNNKLYIGHVGDSAIVMGYETPSEPDFWNAKQLTDNHKPDSPAELERIERCGGKVGKDNKQVVRVICNHLIRTYPPEFVQVPLLNMARSLGDFWSYNPETMEYIVSPVPDTQVIHLDPSVHRCIILASDGLWDVLRTQDVVNTVYAAKKNNSEMEPKPAVQTEGATGTQQHSLMTMNPAATLVNHALEGWRRNKHRADNISVIVVVFH